VLGDSPLHVMAMYVNRTAMRVGKGRPSGEKKDSGYVDRFLEFTVFGVLHVICSSGVSKVSYKVMVGSCVCVG